MNDSYTNKLIIKYKFSQYNHYWFHSEKYRELDILHPTFNHDIYYIIQRLYSSTKSNINIYLNFIIKNRFLNNKKKQIQENIYLYIQKIKRNLHHFVYCCKFKLLKKLNVVNLFYEPFKKNAIYLIEDNIKYGFDIFELKKIVNNSFNYLDIDYPKIIKIKNPYTNKPFSCANIYNIYFYLLSNFSIPFMFHNYYVNNLNPEISSLLCLNNHYIECYKNKYNSYSDSVKINIIKRMFQINKYYNFKNLPEKIIINYFQNIGMNYYIYENLLLNGFNLDIIHHYKIKYIRPLTRFYLKNTNYYRRYSYKTLNNQRQYYTNETINLY